MNVCALVLLQIKKRKKDAEEPTKYMGCGDCDNLSRSITVSCYNGKLEINGKLG